MKELFLEEEGFIRPLGVSDLERVFKPFFRFFQCDLNKTVNLLYFIPINCPSLYPEDL